MPEKILVKFSILRFLQPILDKSVEKFHFPVPIFDCLIIFILIVQHRKQALFLPLSINVEPGKLWSMQVFIRMVQHCNRGKGEDKGQTSIQGGTNNNFFQTSSFYFFVIKAYIQCIEPNTLTRLAKA